MKRPQYDLVPIDKLKHKIKQNLQNHNEIIVAYLYGSYAQEYQTKFSDIDIGIVLEDDFQEPPIYFAELSYEIEKSFDEVINLDIRILNNRPPRFLFHVIKYGKIIYCKESIFKDKFELRVITEYLDIKPLLDYFDNLFLKEVLDDEY